MQADLEQKNLVIQVKDVQLEQHTSAIQRLTSELRETEDRVRQKETQLQQKNADINRLQREVQRLQVCTLLCLCSGPWFQEISCSLALTGVIAEGTTAFWCRNSEGM